jgi:hypothetical protein
LGNAIAFAVPVRNIKVDLTGGTYFPKKVIEAGYSRCSIHVIIPVNENFFAVPACRLNPSHGLVHVFHEPGIMEIGQLRAKEMPGLFEGDDIPLYQYPANDFADPQG